MQLHKLRTTLIIIITSIIALMLSMHLSLFIDESFTMSLIRHSYRSIISLDALDIHPPLYYLILKLFLYVVTFGHQSIVTDTILARLFSFACLLIAFFVTCLTLNTMKLRYNARILYILLTIFMLYIQEVTSIRMYPLAILFVALEFYNLVKYVYRHQTRYLNLLTFFAILAAYTHDYAAVIAGLFILLAFIHNLIKKSYNAYKWLISGIIFFIAYLPWIKISLNQALNLPPQYWILMINSLQDSLLFVTLLLFTYPIFQSFKKISSNNRFIYKLVVNVCLVMLIIELILTLHQPIFIIRYVCPLLFIYITVTYGLLINRRTSKATSKYQMIITALFLIIIGTMGIYINEQYQDQFHYQTVQLQRTFNRQTPKHVNINVPKVTQGNIRHLCQFNTYAQYEHKSLSWRENQLLFNNYKLKQGTNVKLMKRLWKTNN